MNEMHLTVRGNVTSEPRHTRFDDGNTLTSFRLAHNDRRLDPQTREWVNGRTTFLNVNCRRGLAANVAKSLSKGQPVIVTGKLRQRFWEKDGRSGQVLEIEAEGLGHDLAWGSTAFSRVVRTERLTSPSDGPGDTLGYTASIDHGDAPGGGMGLSDADFRDEPDHDPEADAATTERLGGDPGRRLAAAV